MVKRHTIKIILFLLIGTTMFNWVQELLSTSWSQQDNVDYIIQGFEQLESNTLDVLFLGTSHMEYGMSPMKLYQDTNICSYSLASSEQPIECSYFLLKKAFQSQTPQVVLLDASSLFFDESVDRTASWRYILDNLPLDRFKVEMARAYAEMPWSDGMCSVLLPMIEYHSRWNELSNSDLISGNINNGYYSLGQYIVSTVNGTPLIVEDIDSNLNLMLELSSSGSVAYSKNGTIYQETVEGFTYEPKVSEKNLSCFLDILTLCQEHNAKLLLTKIPVMAHPQHYTGSWTKTKSDIVSELAQQYGVPFLDLMYKTDVSLDFTTDTCDGGGHLNIRGSEKVTAYIGEYLLEHYELALEENYVYNEFLGEYQKVREVALLQSELDFISYIKRLQENKAHWTIYFAANDEYTGNMLEEGYVELEQLGLQLVGEGNYWSAYVAAIYQGSILYEAVSDQRIDYTTSVHENVVALSSAGWLVIPHSSINISGVEYGINTRGLNIVVYDNETGIVVDSVTFDTCVEARTPTRNWASISTYLREYESAICFEQPKALG